MLLASGPIGSLKAQDSVFSYTHQGTTLYYIVNDRAEAIVVPPLHPNVHQAPNGDYSTWYGYTQPTGAIAIPDTVPYNGGTYPVKRIGVNAFFDCNAITSVALPVGIEQIDVCAFLGCSSMQGITLPSTLQEIGHSAFGECSSLTTISIPENVIFIDSAAFAMCSQLQTVTLSDGIQIIKWATFANCTNLRSINFPSSLTTIEDYVFNGDNMLGPTIELPNGLTSIGSVAFSNCSSIVGIELPESLNFIDEGAFYNCSGLQSIEIPQGVTTLENSVFEGCSQLQSVTLPEGLTAIYDEAFANCSSLQDIGLPQTLTYVGQWAFYNCAALDTLILPDNVMGIGSAGLALCSNLKHCHLPEQLNRVEGWLLYGAALEELVVPDNVTYIEEQAFAGCPQLHKVTLPASLTTIADSLFIDGTPLDTLILRCQEPPTVPANAFPDFNVTLIVPCGTEEAYSQHAVWGQFATIVENCNAIDEAESHNLKVYSRNGHIVVEGADDNEVQVYDMSGRKVANRNLPTGAYMVKVGDKMAKTITFKQ